MKAPPDFSIVAVVAMARGGVIGQDGAMPWHMPSDLKRYRRLTMGKPMIMGRRTLESIGRVLDGRDTIVLTRSLDFAFDGAIVVASPQEALERAIGCATSRQTDEIVIAGGADIYRQFLPITAKIELTEIAADLEGDTMFPQLDPHQWKRSDVGPFSRGAGDTAESRSVTLLRVDGQEPSPGRSVL